MATRGTGRKEKWRTADLGVVSHSRKKISYETKDKKHAANELAWEVLWLFRHPPRREGMALKNSSKKLV